MTERPCAGGQAAYAYTSVTENFSQNPAPTASEHKKKPTISGRHCDHWIPLSLRLPFLALFGFILLCFLASLLIIRYYADLHNGFKLITTNHYTWTYGPTAIFIIITSFWRLIDYHCKALLPWSELAKGPVGADRSLLLDHLSPFLLITMSRATVKGHFVVILTILGFLLLKLVTVASTGLLIPTSVTVGPLDICMEDKA